jgi:alcohol dehydrogenase class IV
MHSAYPLLAQNSDTAIAFGEEARNALARHLSSLECTAATPLFVVGGGRSSWTKSGAEALMDAVASLDGIPMVPFLGVPAEPDIEVVRSMTAQMKSCSPKAVVAIGGGSVMDAAKAAYLSYQSDLDIRELFGAGLCAKRFPGRHFERVICVPTTSGTGSEATPYANIIDRPGGVKRLVMDNEIVAEHSFVIPRLTWTAPEELTAITGLDAFVHAVESLLNFRAAAVHPEATAWGLSAVRLIRKALPIALGKAPGFVALARAELSLASTLAGMCIKVCPTSLPHLCSFSVCGHAAHGAAVASLLPNFWRWYLEASRECAERTRLLSPLLGGTEPLETVQATVEFIESCGISTHPGRLTGLPASFIDQLAKDAAQNPMKLESAPRPLTAEGCQVAFHEALDGYWN